MLISIGANGPQEQGIVPLKYAETDVERLKRAFSHDRCAFTKVESVVAKNPHTVLVGLEHFANQCEPSDLLVVHFSGHALLSDGSLYLVCNETDYDRQLFITTALKISTVKNILFRCKANHKLLILDCCHAGVDHAGGIYNRGEEEQEFKYALNQDLTGGTSVIFQPMQPINKLVSLIACKLASSHGLSPVPVTSDFLRSRKTMPYHLAILEMVTRYPGQDQRKFG